MLPLYEECRWIRLSGETCLFAVGVRGGRQFDEDEDEGNDVV